jgi:hypothetical protein
VNFLRLCIGVEAFLFWLLLSHIGGVRSCVLSLEDVHFLWAHTGIWITSLHQTVLSLPGTTCWWNGGPWLGTSSSQCRSANWLTSWWAESICASNGWSTITFLVLLTHVGSVRLSMLCLKDVYFLWAHTGIWITSLHQTVLSLPGTTCWWNGGPWLGTSSSQCRSANWLTSWWAESICASNGWSTITFLVHLTHVGSVRLSMLCLKDVYFLWAHTGIWITSLHKSLNRALSVRC